MGFKVDFVLIRQVFRLTSRGVLLFAVPSG